MSGQLPTVWALLVGGAVSTVTVLGLFRLRIALGWAPVTAALGAMQLVALALEIAAPVGGDLWVHGTTAAVVPATILVLLVAHVREGTDRARELLLGLVCANLLGGALLALFQGAPHMLLEGLLQASLVFIDALVLLTTYEVVGRLVSALWTRVFAAFALVLHAHAILDATLVRLGAEDGFGLLMAELAGATLGTVGCTLVGCVYLYRFEDRAWTWIHRNQPLLDVLPILTLRQRAPLRTHTMRDDESGVYTRLFFDDALPIEVERAEQLGRQAAIVVLDLEAEAAEVGGALLQTLRMTDLPCRLSPSGYAAILPGADRRAAEASAKRVVAVLNDRRRREGRAALPVSWGVACYPEDGDRPVSLLAAAERRRARSLRRSQGASRATNE